MTSTEPDRSEFVPVAEIEIDAVRPIRTGFVLRGRGADSGEYRIDLNLDFPVDRRTQTVVAEILSQSEWRIRRRTNNSLRRPSPRKKPARQR